MYQQPKMPIFLLFLSAGALFDGAFFLWVSLSNVYSPEIVKKENRKSEEVIRLLKKY